MIKHFGGFDCTNIPVGQIRSWDQDQMQIRKCTANGRNFRSYCKELTEGEVEAEMAGIRDYLWQTPGIAPSAWQQS